MNLSVIVLAAGKGSRMRSKLPKVLHDLAGRPLLKFVTRAAQSLNPHMTVVVYGHGGESVREALADETLEWVEQAEQLGTGHAVEHAMPGIADEDSVLVLYGDVPLIESATLQAMCEPVSSSVMSLLTTRLDNPHGYGRIVRDADDKVLRIVEQKDASEAEQQIDEINTGILAANAKALRGWLAELENNNAQGEFYLTDIIALAVRDKVEIETFAPASIEEVQGVNDRAQLATLERHYQLSEAQRLMREGLGLRDPARFDLRGELSFGSDVVIDVNAVIEGTVTLGDGVTIGPSCVIRNCNIADGVEIQANCVLEDATIGEQSRIGPFARLRPEAHLADHTHIGNFVEIKKSVIGSGSKVNHLSYVGDTTIGSRVNIGAGTITCNYDGAYKHRTIIGDDVFVGSDSQLVAPVEIGAGATIGAGSTITRDTPPGELSLTRSKQKIVSGWKRPKKEK
ncbi:UDP-N-acetylglucosamine diphosphorylase/glucosamine-1-phosphate N-acetyltransferase [Solemya pervernicosa gill symbiont]|uniref:Bifunctional protein GlmU n=2 Tax=Gammaproteobacteria incertae sedis TaxID=118884 RepID=A0A1T2L2Q4_9GAMM|nr:bifunctional UDP-N-acetylglucosamine diphosphorylase/glucosamine-1-phosphate N-acetyltransferase GlmU [Candidatus Reidiella endopervernicosa]OOZ39377.1 UDP-N-acetylglucosamine diphosphorylase/glucosamine-1-phosphate N-acetyltransferase [Solemya pervernicosa gill symbiont]QKQ25321.1 bifunctional UDP-N-acetylglucosamine diphosphorylase/glucosamine-1-phosphate N-acetyltransferase GlmU [Candidatus Reidiella endopervernicosa]